MPRGNLTTSGSLANMIAVVTARDAKGIDPRTFPARLSTSRSRRIIPSRRRINMAGCANARFDYISLDEKYRMKSDDLRVSDRG